ncbi:MAG: ATP-binding cassette domain-containing protein, partial [Spirochaetales bacterium]|nr:ATP-binding cassette domain-containing protein [Spirochaetales bacterium]
MISVSNVSLAFGRQILFKDVNIKFTPGNCYGVIGANGAGKSTFLKILSGETDPDAGEITVSSGERIAVLKQDHFTFNDYSVLETVIMGSPKLYEVLKEKDAIYAKADFSEADGIKAAELESDFAELGGWEAEAQAGAILSGLGVAEALHSRKMKEVEDQDKVRTLLAQALFGEPDILLLDEPTNGLDLESIAWLEEFLLDFNNTLIVVSHDRHFLNKVCTHIADIDYGQIAIFVGNYDFWYQTSQLIRSQMKDEKKRRDEKIAELKEFIQRFSSNASKARQATSRKKLIDKLTVDDLRASSRRFPYVNFKPDREGGRRILEIENLCLSLGGERILNNFNLEVSRGDKIAFVGPLHQTKTALFQALMEELRIDSGVINWGVTISPSYYPKDNTAFFESDQTIIQWISQYSAIKEETYVRGFLGRMLFSGDEGLKSVAVLSGGEKVRCMLARMMLSGANALILDEPTNHLDLEAITALNNGLVEYPETVLFNSHDHTFVTSVANRIIEFTPGEAIDR